MAVDEALMDYARNTGECVLRVYRWKERTLSFGRNQTAHGLYDSGRLREAGVDCVRRPTGGRAVLHYREVTYAVAAPEMSLGPPRTAYARINGLLVRALALLGVAAESSDGAGYAESRSANPCFDRPSRGELTTSGRKLVGSAQCRDAGAILQHGSILTHDDQSLIAGLMDHRAPQSAPPATLSEAMGRSPDWIEVAEALRQALRESECSEPLGLAIDDLPAQPLALGMQKYADDHWTWRR
jgi:lipoate-protein ligase A